MTTEETELTFIRCPGCRSLVPAVATRCRMCGELLESRADKQEKQEPTSRGAAESEAPHGRETASEDHEALDQPDPLGRRSRVRQKTMSVSEHDVSAVKETLGPRHDSPFERPTHSQAPSPSQPRSAVDVRSDTGKIEQRAESGSHFRIGGKSHDVVADRPATREAFSSPVEPPSTREREAPLPPSGDSSAAIPARFSDRPAIESPRPISSDPNRTGFGQARDEQGGELRPKKRRRRRKRKRGAEGMAPTFEQQSIEPKPFESKPLEQRMFGEKRADFNTGGNRERELRREENMLDTTRDFARETHSEPTDRSNSVRVKPLTKPSVPEEGGLMGWFVNYRDGGSGSAIEIRSGRYFIGRESVKKSDLVVHDESVSTPHCLVSASPSKGLKVQDLMSERGTFVRRRNQDSFFQYTDPVTLHHGDWLRFGDYEVLIVLISLGEG